MIENVLEAIADAVVVIDGDGAITLANTAAVELSGYTRDELRGMPIGSLLVDDGSGLRTVVRRRIEHGNVLRREDSNIATKAGERIPVSITGAPVLDQANVLQGIVLVARDIRELRQAQEELRAAKESIEEQLEETRRQLLLAERRATLGTLAGGVGHELRNIAQIQVSAVEALADAQRIGEPLGPLLRRVLPELERVGAHIAAHGQRLMQLARPGADTTEDLDLERLVRDIVAMLRGAGKLRRVLVAMVFAKPPLLVTINRIRIEQVLVNLLVNAVDAIGEAGMITVELHPSADNLRIACSVIDTGCGIPDDELERIFEPFFTTKAPEHGTGLGLSVAKEIVEGYGGKLAVTSRVGIGTTFTFDLPSATPNIARTRTRTRP